MNPIALKTECIGRVLIDLPQKSDKNWMQSFDQANVARLPFSIKTDEDFWGSVEKRKQELEKSPHDTNVHLLVAFRREQNAAILLYYPFAEAKSGYDMDRYLWLGDRGYFFKTQAMPLEDKSQLDPYSEIFHKLAPRDGIPTQPGICMDGALVTGKVGEISVYMSLDLPSWKNAGLWVGVGEGDVKQAAAPDNSDEANTNYRELQRQQDAMREIAQEMPAEAATDPVFPKEFVVLRKHDRAINGMAGQEVVWRKKLNNGSELYTLRWETTGDSGTPDRPGVGVGIDVGNSDHPEQTPPAEAELLAFWDTVLTSLRTRPGAH